MHNEKRGHKNGWDKSKLVSRYTTVGPSSAPHRAMLRAMGLTDEDIAKPLVGVATCWNEAAPCNIKLSEIAQSVKKGVKEATSKQLQVAVLSSAVFRRAGGRASPGSATRSNSRVVRLHWHLSGN